jgi:hypothetical protein
MAAAALGPADPPPPPAGAAAPWQARWQQLLERLHGAGHFAADAHVSANDLGADKAAVKRAVLRFARQRADILAALDGEWLRALVVAGLPESERDRKARNAHRRLQASVLRGEDLGPGDGGAADLQDVLRMLLALDAAAAGICTDGDHAGLAAAAAALLPEVLAAMEAPPPEGAALSEKAKNMQRLKQGERAPVPRRPRAAVPWDRPGDEWNDRR